VNEKEMPDLADFLEAKRQMKNLERESDK